MKEYSQQNIADELGMSVAAYSNIERGKTDISVTRLFQIAGIFGTTAAHLISESGDPEDFQRYSGFAIKQDFEDLSKQLRSYRKEIDLLKQEISSLKVKSGGGKRKSKGA